MNNKGYTLVELLGTLIILGILLAVTIPNIVGISTQNKITAYAEDAKRFKNTAEYMFRSDDSIEKPLNRNCIIVNLKHIHEDEYDNPPYGGTYDMDNSFVLMVKKNQQYKYYVQLVEKFESGGTDNYRGFSLIDSAQLEGSNYLDKVVEGTNMEQFINIPSWDNKDAILLLERKLPSGSSESVKTITGCDVVTRLFYTSQEEV